MHDILIIGGGPAGMTAALYALRSNKSVLILEKDSFGGQIAHSPKVENYPGSAAFSGVEFADRLMEQIVALGADFELEEAVALLDEGATKRVRTREGNEYCARSVIYAAGVRHRQLGLPNEEALTGNGVSYCAVCDGDFYRGQAVAVAGGGNSALQEAMLLSGLCRQVTVLEKTARFRGEARLLAALEAKENVTLLTETEVAGLLSGPDGLSGLCLRTPAGERELPAAALFVAIGLQPENAAFADVLPLDAAGYVACDESCRTDKPGIFVAGDCRAKELRQLVTATADGAAAAVAACRYLEE